VGCDCEYVCAFGAPVGLSRLEAARAHCAPRARGPPNLCSLRPAGSVPRRWGTQYRVASSCIALSSTDTLSRAIGTSNRRWYWSSRIVSQWNLGASTALARYSRPGKSAGLRLAAQHSRPAPIVFVAADSRASRILRQGSRSPADLPGAGGLHANSVSSTAQVSGAAC